MFKPHELVTSFAASIPSLMAYVLEALGVELDGLTEIRVVDMGDGIVKGLRFMQNLLEFLVREFERSHIRIGSASTRPA